MLDESRASLWILWYSKWDRQWVLRSRSPYVHILTIYDPAYEVSNSGIQNTIELFEQKGFFYESLNTLGIHKICPPQKKMIDRQGENRHT